MTKEEFQQLLQRYKQGSCSLDEIKKIDSWFAKIAKDNLELDPLEQAVSRERMLSAIRQGLSSERKSTNIMLIGSRVLKVAAVLVITVLVVYLVFPRTHFSDTLESGRTDASSNLIKQSNTTNDILKIQLPDASVVELKPNSTISYSKEWKEKKREVHLVGEAFFEVIKDSSRPFYVYGGDIVTKVLGTSFSVKATADAESIEVAVRIGKVSVYEGTPENDLHRKGNEASGVILTPNEKVEYFKKDSHWVTSLVREPKALPTVNKAVELVFSNTPMTEIVNSIEATYSIDVILESEASYSCAFTGDVSMMELYDMLEVICKSTGTNYEIKGTKILITGRGCE